MIFPNYKVLRSFFFFALKYNRLKIFLSFIITLFLGLTKGASFIMLLPVLRLAGVTDSTSDHSSRAFEIVAVVWNMLGISFTIYSSLALYLVLVLIYAVLGYIKTLLDTDIIQSFKQTLRDDLFVSVIRAEWGFIKNARNTHIFNNIITEIDILGAASQLLLSSFGTAIIFMIYLATSLYVSFKMTLIASLCFLPLLIAQRRFNKRAYKTGEEMYERHQSLFSAVLEFINSFKLAKSYNLQERYATEFRTITRQTAEDDYKFAKIRASTSILYEVGSAVIICIILIWAIQIVRMPVVDLLLIVYIATRLLPNISSLTRNFQYILNTLPSFLGVTNLLEDAQKNEEETQGLLSLSEFSQGSIKFNKIRFSYEGDPPIFDNFSCDILFNKTTTLIGESGKGKSTLVEMLLGLLKPQKGEIMVNGLELNEIDLLEWRNATAYIPQECFLFNASIRQNLLWAKPDATEDELHEALHSAAGDFVLKLPHGLETLVGDQGIRLSGGERQRIALARALLRKPRILILDEATNALDAENENLIKESLQRLKGKVTILIISHDESMRDLADEVIFV